MKKKLSINEKVPVHTFSYFGYPLSIISSKERVNSRIVKMKVFDYQKSKWEQDWSSFQLARNGEEWIFHTDSRYLENMNGYMCRELLEEDEIHIRIDYQQYSHPLGAVNLFIADCEETDLKIGDDDFICRLGNVNREGAYFCVQNLKQKINEYNHESVMELILYRNGSVLEAFVVDQTDGKKVLLGRQTQKIPKKDSIRIGIQIKENDNMYYRWLFANFIQLSCDVTNQDRKLDFFYGIMKNWDSHWVNFFLNSNEIPRECVLAFGTLAFIRHYIKHGNYIEVKITQYYDEGFGDLLLRAVTLPCMIYGFDDEKKLIYMMRYTENGTVEMANMTYIEAKQLFAKKEFVSDVRLVSYEQDAYAMEYHEEYLMDMLRQYQKGVNSSRAFNHIVEETNRKYGISIYEELCSDNGIEAILSDKNILHLLYEHKTIMKKRMKYMTAHGSFPAELGKQAAVSYDRISEMAIKAINLVIKYTFDHDETIIAEIKAVLRTMRAAEECTLVMLLGK